MTISKIKAVKPNLEYQKKPIIGIFGRAGVGKTKFSLAFPNVCYVDTEGGALQREYQKELLESGGVYFGIEQGSQNPFEIMELLKALATEKHNLKTLVIDGVSKLVNISVADYEHKRLEAEAKKGVQQFDVKSDFGASKKPAAAMFRQILRLAEKLDMNVIFTFHEKAKWLGEKQVGVTFDGPDKVDYELEALFHVYKDNQDNRLAQVVKSRIKAFPDASVFEWDFKKFAKQYGEDIIYGDRQVFVFATQEQIDKVKILIDLLQFPEKEVDAWLLKQKAESFEEVAEDKMNVLINFLTTKLNNLTKTKE